MFEQSRKIDLSLPQSWNLCTVEQLRMISATMLYLTQRSTPLRPFSMDRLKIVSFFLLAGLEMVAPLNPRLPVEEQYYLVRFRSGRARRLINWLTGRNKPFSLYLWQVSQWALPRKSEKGKILPGMLDWMDSDSKDFFVIFPFEKVKRRRSLLFWGKSKVFRGPSPMLDGFTWQRFRFAQDYMLHYTDAMNNLVRVQNLGRRASSRDILEAVRHHDTAKAFFLATIFEACTRFTDDSTGVVRCDFHYQSNQATDNLEYFRNFSDVDWQIVLLWWSGIMKWLGKTYPHVFKRKPQGDSKAMNPLEIYAKTTATMEKYVGLNADEVEREPYTVVLQQMENLSIQNEEIEKMRKK